MKKFWNLMLVALVMLGAAACTETNESVDASQESLSFYAEISNDATRADLEYDDVNKVWNTVWEGNETIAVKNANGTIFNFSNTKEEKSKFTCTQDGVKALRGQSVNISIANPEQSKAGKSGVAVSVDVEEFDTTKTIKLVATNSYLRYTFNGEGKVEFSLTYEGGQAFVYNEGQSFDSVAIEGVKGENFVSFNAPAEGVEAELTCSINGYEVKSTTIDVVAGKVYNLGEIAMPFETSAYSVPGVHNNWSTTATPMYIVGDYCVAYGVTTTEFKINGNDKWYGAPDFAIGKWTAASNASDVANITLENGTYDIYFLETRTMLCVVEAGATVPELPVFTMGLVGSFQDWDVAAPIAMSPVADGWVVASSVELYKSDEFKFVNGYSWSESYGSKDAVLVASEGEEYTLTTTDGKNIKVTKNGKFDIYFNTDTKNFKYECVEDYADLTVNITINNKANWSPLYIYLEDNGTPITPETGALVENNVYAVSASYIGSTLTCKFISGDKVSDVMSVTIDKSGATVTLEETIVKLYFQLNTSNAKQWWGDTTKIHVWNTGTSFDTSWPGNTMTPEGNYTWSIIVPSELVGKTINFLVHNGNGWQSKDSQVTINAEGTTVTGSSIGVN